MSIPSFPDIAEYFNISEALTQMTIAVNFFGFCLSSIVYGPLSDSYGRRSVMLYGNAIMTLGACICALANNIEILLFARFIQGLGASTSAVVAFAVIADSYSADKSAKIIGIMNSMITIFMSAAPIAGGFINEAVGWRGSYIIIAVISLTSWVLLYFRLPETNTNKFVFISKNILQNFKQIIFDRKFIYSSLAPSLIYAGWMSFVACGAFLYTGVYGLSIIKYTLHQGAVISVFSLFSFYCFRVHNLLGQKRSIISGIILMLGGGIIMTVTSLSYAKAPYLTTVSMMIYSIGSAISYPIIFTKSLDIYPNLKGTSSSLIMSVRALLCSLFISLSSYFYDDSLTSIAFVILIIVLIYMFLIIKLLKIPSFDIN